MELFETPVLFLIFNRPDLTETVFRRIREVRPKYLYVAADGPRPAHPEDADKCKQSRQVVMDMIDWDCEIKTLFRDENMGCGRSVSGAITWFFEHVEEGIILEDDCLPDLSFFRFCEELLKRYHDNSTVMHIGGVNFQKGKFKEKSSYYYSNYSHVWGWATWKRAWKNYRHQVSSIDSDYLNKILKDRSQADFWKKIAVRLDRNHIDTWDYRWHLSIFRCRGVSIIPNKNLVINLGFGNDATHTKKISMAQKVESISLPLDFPKQITIDYKADKYTFNKHYVAKTSSKNHLRNIAYSIIPAKFYLTLKKYYVAVFKSY